MFDHLWPPVLAFVFSVYNYYTKMLFACDLPLP